MEERFILNVLYGSVEMDTSVPGFTRTIKKDKDGMVVSDVTTHLVCLGTTHCMYCGRSMEQ